MRLTCPNNPEHKTFTMTVMSPETWYLNEDGDCEIIEDVEERHMPVKHTPFDEARCAECDEPTVIEKE